MTKKFILRGTKDEKTIYLRIRDGINVDYKVSTSIKISSKNWDKTKNWPKDSVSNDTFFQIDQELNEILKSVRMYEYGPGKEKQIDRSWLTEAINFNSSHFRKDRVLVTDQLGKYRDRLRSSTKNGKHGVSAGTIRNYNTTISRLDRFETEKGHKYSLDELSFQFHDDYLSFATQKMDLAINSIGKDIRNIKAMCSDAKDRGLKVNENVFSKRFHPPTEKTDFVVLNISELEALMKFNGPDYLKNARDWLIIGCWTGCRVNDLMKLNNKNIKERNGFNIITYTQSKTRKPVSLAIHPHVQSIIEQNNNSFPRPISDVKFNEYIKKVCSQVGLDELIEGIAYNDELKKRIRDKYPKWKLVRSHICRRSFATNHYGKVPTSKIRAATGHSTEKLLLNYIGETEQDHIDDFIDVWNINKK